MTNAGRPMTEEKLMAADCQLLTEN